MKLLVEIDEKKYVSIKKCLESGMELDAWQTAVANGAPLPKGHGRLIDESLLREDMETAYKYANELVALGFAESFLEHAPTIIEADKEVDK